MSGLKGPELEGWPDAEGVPELEVPELERCHNWRGARIGKGHRMESLNMVLAVEGSQSNAGIDTWDDERTEFDEDCVLDGHVIDGATNVTCC